MTRETTDDRKLAIWMGIVDIQECTCRKFLTGRWPDGHCGHIDFRADESANAMLLEKAQLTVSPFGPVGWHAFRATDWHVGPEGQYWGMQAGRPAIYANDADRKTAIVLAAVALAAAEEE